MAYFPAFLKLDNKKILIVGGGYIAYEKLDHLLDFTKDISVIALDLSDDMARDIKENNLNRIVVAACSPYSKFPTTRGWAAKQRFGNLPDYAIAEGSDIQQFASFDSEARLLIEGGETAKRLPSYTSLWFKLVHQEVDELIAKAKDVKSDDQNKEFISLLDWSKEGVEPILDLAIIMQDSLRSFESFEVRWRV